MSTTTEAEIGHAKRRAALPTAPCSVVWSKGHAYVLEGFRARWVGVDDRGRPQALTGAELQRRGWSRTR
ncbi:MULTISPECIES: hypothetical protein [Actinosynnema]|uniref:Uncharacterized protein n=1 Tax=Actinosynnema pretiosum TaxID=42197 RepID=A0A290ZBM7_9PSEU|nr:hypothetical protein [Actinosynnema pretiosum]ATE56418.1 hypothetical protein CNX65_26690 [Actinosynnema pretiosum]